MTSTNSYFELVYEVTRNIPKGRVTNYGAIADFLSLGSARMASRLRKEGVKVKEDKVVDFELVFWHPREMNLE